MTERYTTEQNQRPERPVTSEQVKTLLREHDPAVILAADGLLTQLPHLRVTDGELTPVHTLDERIDMILE